MSYQGQVTLKFLLTSVETGSMATCLSTYKSRPAAIHVVIRCEAIIPHRAPLPLATGHKAASTNTPSRAPEVADVTSSEPSTTPPTIPTQSDRHIMTIAAMIIRIY